MSEITLFTVNLYRVHMQGSCWAREDIAHELCREETVVSKSKSACKLRSSSLVDSSQELNQGAAT